MRSKVVGGKDGITIVEKFDENDNSLGYFVIDEEGNETGPMSFDDAEKLVKELIKKLEKSPVRAPRMGF
jgi:hypothetical protein